MMTVTLVYSPKAREVIELPLQVADTCTVTEALKVSGILVGIPAETLDALQVGVWGRKATLSQQLRDHDRIELVRMLRVDPKVARRERFVRQGSKSAGLFTKLREGAKAGY
jgi:putative ubiquitin-RnfH superfamily antitoxin RatB of RatAB toxin-antitoxin module